MALFGPVLGALGVHRTEASARLEEAEKRTLGALLDGDPLFFVRFFEG